MVNFGLNAASILGIFLAVAGAGLYFLRSIRPELSRDHDIFFAAVGLLCGLILLFQGWRLDPILQFNQLLLTGTVVFFAVETIRLRGVATEQARRNTPIVDERPISREYRAELEQLEPYDIDDIDDRYENNPRLRGYEDPRSSRNSAYESDESRVTRTRRPSSSSDPYSSKDSRKRRPRPSTTPSNESYDQWQDSPNAWNESSSRTRRPSDETATESRPPKRRPRPTDQGRPRMRDDEPVKGQYVDYQAIDDVNQSDNNWDEPSLPKPKPEREREPKTDNPMRFDY